MSEIERLYSVVDSADPESYQDELQAYYNAILHAQSTALRFRNVGCAQHANDGANYSHPLTPSTQPLHLSRPRRPRARLPTPRAPLQLHRRPTIPGVIFYDLSIQETQEAIHVASFNFNSTEQCNKNVGSEFHVHVFECLEQGVPIDYLDAIVFYELDRAVQDGFIDEDKGEGLWRAWVGHGEERMVYGEDPFWDT